MGTMAVAEGADETTHARIVKLLSLDGIGGVVAGLFVLALHGPIAGFYRMPVAVVVFVAVANVVYGSYSSRLAWRASRGTLPSRRAVEVLAIANACWPLVCIALLVHTREAASVFGQLHLGLEGVYVFALAVVEWRWLRPRLA